jgi:hypothetical protein
LVREFQRRWRIQRGPDCLPRSRSRAIARRPVVILATTPTGSTPHWRANYSLNVAVAAGIVLFEAAADVSDRAI